MVRHFTKDVLPIVKASKQNAAAFTAGDLLFDWKSFTLPKRGAKLVGVTALIRSKGDANPTPNNFGLDLVFGRIGTSLGTANAVGFVSTPQNDIFGSVNIATSNYVKAVSTSCLSVATVSGLNISITPDDNTVTKNEEEIYYVAGVANGAFDFITLNKFAESGDAEAASTEEITMGGTDMDVRKHFIEGDVLAIGTSVGAPAADSAIGTLKTAGSATSITLTTTSTSAVVTNDLLYNTSPIRLKLHFEK
tara:strand:+ start:796 stop:1542 length:747 start_codon:yes stop_codon:yes gene_type:complete